MTKMAPRGIKGDSNNDKKAVKTRPHHACFPSSDDESSEGEVTKVESSSEESEDDTNFISKPTPRPKVYTMSGDTGDDGDDDVSSEEFFMDAKGKEDASSDEDDRVPAKVTPEKKTQVKMVPLDLKKTGGGLRQKKAEDLKEDPIEEVSEDENLPNLPETNNTEVRKQKDKEEALTSSGRKVTRRPCKTPRDEWVVSCDHCGVWGSKDPRGLGGHLAYCEPFQQAKREQEEKQRDERKERYAEGTPQHAKNRKAGREGSVEKDK